MQKIHYILTHIINPEYNKMVGLIKAKGPKFLIGKITVPGGKIEENEDIYTSASRETFEETGLVIEPTSWYLFNKFETQEYVLNKVFAVTSDIEKAYTKEEEQVIILDLPKSIEDAVINPDKYTPDFVENYHALISWIDCALSSSE